jgi:hypothetical protein
MKSLRALPVALLLLAVAIGAHAQTTRKPARDPRPLPPTDVSTIKPFVFGELPSGSLLDKAVPVGRATFTRVDGGISTLGTVRLGDAAQIMGINIERGANGSSLWMRGSIGRIAPLLTKDHSSLLKARATSDVLDLLQTQATALGILKAHEELVASDVSIDELGYQHFRFDQMYRGIPVWGRDIYVHANPTGDVYLVNGDLAPTPALAQATAAIDAERALAIVVARLKAENRWAPPPDEVMRWLDMPFPSTRGVYYPAKDGSMRLAYEVTLHPNLLENITYIIDASNGAQLNRIDNHCSLLPGEKHNHVSRTGLERRIGRSRILRCAGYRSRRQQPLVPHLSPHQRRVLLGVGLPQLQRRQFENAR